ncbi:MAG TPA: class IV adenylate cyclase [Blastocatellia bacterium]|nr:class IV adenylate cyclase [Blastocatellia bacterium]
MAGHEIEVKLRLDNVEPLAAAGVRLELETARHFEDNWLLDTADRQLYERGAVLRVRSTSGTEGTRGLLTLKEQAPADAPASQFKVRLETETMLDEPEQAIVILERLGYRKIFRYQKFRTIYRALLSGGDHLLVMFDETPLGNFVELEGEEGAISEVVRRLGIGPDDYILQSYVALQAQRCQWLGRPLEDMVFERADS